MQRRFAGARLGAPLFLAAILVGFGCAPKADDATKIEEATKSAADAAKAAADSIAALKASTMPVEPETPPDHIEVQHVLIGFAGKIPGKNVTRTQAEAEKLAGEILQRARDGEDFDALVQKYTDDQWPGIYGMANDGVPPLDANEIPRNGMVKGFSDVSFSLSPGNIGMASYDPKTSPYGWHIIKRLK